MPDQGPIHHSPSRVDRPLRVAVDLTPMLPGGENGGAKILVLELLRHFRECADGWHFVLLTSDLCHDELAQLDGPHLERICVLRRSQQTAAGTAQRLRSVGRRIASRIPPALAQKVIELYWALSRRRRRSSLLQEHGVDLLFCPFSAPTYHTEGIPSVCVVYDLQFATYPQFFEPEERYGREANFREACRSAARLICISDYVRGCVLEASEIEPARVRTIPIQMASRLRARHDPSVDTRVLQRHGLRGDGYLLYPANFWRHKNHRMLLTAFAQYADSHPSSDLKLVFTGQPGDEMAALADASVAMSLEERCLFAGFVPEADLATLLHHCRGVIFPSLYEGFGMPVLEAMEHGVPVACSNRTSLPEVAGGAAALFDPRIPAEIAEAIRVLAHDEAFRERARGLGTARRKAFADPTAMTKAYLQQFRAALDVLGP